MKPPRFSVLAVVLALTATFPAAQTPQPPARAKNAVQSETTAILVDVVVRDKKGQSVTDLTPLRGMAIKKLWLAGTKASDLSPLQGMPLELLHLGGVGPVDLSGIRGMSLTELRLHGSRGLKDISVLRGMPLATLRLHDCP